MWKIWSKIVFGSKACELVQALLVRNFLICGSWYWILVLNHDFGWVIGNRGGSSYRRQGNSPKPPRPPQIAQSDAVSENNLLSLSFHPDVGKGTEGPKQEGP